MLVPNLAWAYPEFVGYKYSTCLTCHYNGQGNGPLNEYGRALFAAELSSRKFAGSKTDEQLGEDSGFLRERLPAWLKPGIKARNLVYRPNPGGQGEARFILMQAEINAAILFDQDQKFIFVGSYGHAPIPNRLKGQPVAADTSEWISREHYFRWMYSEKMWIYAGMQDKVYGLRIVNHTAYSRARTGLAQNDQTHGVMLHYINPTWEWTNHFFAGNLYQDADIRQMGYSTMYEYEIAEAWRLGASLLYSQNNYVSNRRFGVHTKTGLGYGSSLLYEMGLINDVPKVGDAKLGYYLFSEAQQRIVRGYHTFVSGHQTPPRHQLQFRSGGVIWQENLKVRNDTSQGNMETQSQGILTSLAYLIPTGAGTWLQSYSLDFGFGAIKGKGRTPAIPDELKGQLWLMGGFSPGLLYRTSPISAVGFMLPFSYRLIEWKLKDGSSFNPEGDSSFSVGLSVRVHQPTH